MLVSMISRPIAAAAVAIALMAGTGPAQAQELPDDRIDLIVPYGPGGGSTTHARLYAPVLEQTLPGNPTILIRNIDGAGSVVGINQFQQDAKPDGLTFASIATGTFFQYILDNPAVHYDLPAFKPFLASPFGLLVYARKDLGLSGDPVEDIKHLIENPPVYGGSGATSSDLPALLSIDLLGIEPRYLFGLSNGETRAGLMRGEIGLNYDNMASWADAVQPLVEDGTVVPLFTFGFQNEDGEMVRDPMLPEVPTFLEVYEEIHGEPLSGEARRVWEALFNIRVMGSKIFVLPPETPQEIVDIYANAAKEAVASPEMKSEQAKAIISEYPQSTGAAAKRVFDGAMSMTDTERQWLKDWLSETHQVEF
ncbi:MAG TPA: hypothetical protein VFM24_08575 [Nitrospira sp.]|nr:hypothetical protein [Nitrospira sp.]